MKTQDLFSLKGRIALITGGSRGIGRMIAEGFIAQGAKVYISARKADACDQTAKELSKDGGTCISIPMNVSTVAGAKVAGAAHLDELTAGLNLGAFMLFSSISATWGSGLQPAYAAANAYLDALAEQRRSRGLPATSVAWGPWGGGGMSTGDAAAQLERLGLRLMDPDLAVAALELIVEHDEGPVTIADVDWARFAPAFTVRRASPLIAGLAEVRQALSQTSVVPEAQAALGQRLAGLSPAEQGRVLLELVRTEAAAVLGHRSPDGVSASHAFKELGFDSLTAIELRNRLNTATGLRLPATMIFDYPTITDLANYLRTQLIPASQTAPPPAPAPRPAGAGEPVAIVAMSCRFPGGVSSPEDLWDLLAAGTDAIGDSCRHRARHQDRRVFTMICRRYASGEEEATSSRGHAR